MDFNEYMVNNYTNDAYDAYTFYTDRGIKFFENSITIMEYNIKVCELTALLSLSENNLINIIKYSEWVNQIRNHFGDTNEVIYKLQNIERSNYFHILFKINQDKTSILFDAINRRFKLKNNNLDNIIFIAKYDENNKNTFIIVEPLI